MSETVTLAQSREHRLGLTGNLLSDLETRENLEEGVFDRLIFSANRSAALNKDLLDSLKELSGDAAWGVYTGYSLETLRSDAEQKYVTKTLQDLYSVNTMTGNPHVIGSAAAGIVSDDDSANAASASLKNKKSKTGGNKKQDSSNNNNNNSAALDEMAVFDEPIAINIPEIPPFTELLQQLAVEQVADEYQPRLRATLDRQFLKPLFPDIFTQRLASLSKLLLSVSNVIIVSNQESPQAAVGASMVRGGGRRSTMFGTRYSAQQWRRKHQALEDEIRELISPSSTAGASVAAGAAAAASANASGGMDPQTASRVERLLDEDLDTCEKWFDQAARSASDFVCDSTAHQQQQQQMGGGVGAGRQTISSAFLLQTKEEISDMIQTLFAVRNDKADALQRIRQDEVRLERFVEDFNAEDLKARVAFRNFADDNLRELNDNFLQQNAVWQRLLKEMEALQQLSARANTLVRRHVSRSEAELERRQQFAEMQRARERQQRVAEKLRHNMKAALRFIEVTAEFLGHGQAQITTAKVGAELANGLREAAAALHEAYFEYAVRLCRRIHQLEQRIASAELVQRNVDKSLSDIKSTKVIADEAGMTLRQLTTTRDVLRERLDAATEKLERHLGLHRSISDAESANHTLERPVQQRVRDVEVALREDVIRTLASHFSAENVFLDVARNRLDVATKMSGGDAGDSPAESPEGSGVQ